MSEEQENINFWTAERREELAFSHKNLLKASMSDKQYQILEDIYQTWGILRETLVHFGCGFHQRLAADGQRTGWLVLPYGTGFNRAHIFDKKALKRKPGSNDGLVNMPVPDSRPGCSYFGASAVSDQPGSRLFIVQNSFSAMLLWQTIGQFSGADVVSYLFPFQQIPTPLQKEWLTRQINQTGWDQIYLVLDHNPEKEDDRKTGIIEYAKLENVPELLMIDVYEHTASKNLMEFLCGPSKTRDLQQMISQAEPVDTTFS